MKTKLINWYQTIRDGKIVTIEERITKVPLEEVMKGYKKPWWKFWS